MIAAQSDKLPGLAERNQLVKDTTRVRATIDVVPDRDELIAWVKLERRQQSLQYVGVAMYVTNGEVTHRSVPCQFERDPSSQTRVLEDEGRVRAERAPLGQFSQPRQQVWCHILAAHARGRSQHFRPGYG